MSNINRARFKYGLLSHQLIILAIHQCKHYSQIIFVVAVY